MHVLLRWVLLLLIGELLLLVVRRWRALLLLLRGPVALIDAQGVGDPVKLGWVLLGRARRRLLAWLALVEGRHLPHGVAGDAVEEVGPVLALGPELAPA